MHKHALFSLVILGVISAAFCEERQERKQKQTYSDPFAALDHHITHTLAYHYLWPWSQLLRAAAGLEQEGNGEPKIISDKNKFEINLNVKRFKPDELKVKVKNRYITVEGKQKVSNDNQHFMANHFMQSFAMPAGSKQEEVTAVLNENGVLTISVPKHELPPPPPEIEVPIEVRFPTQKPDDITEKDKVVTEENKTETTTEKKIEAEKPLPTSSATPLEQLELVEATTHVGKIRKKELKVSTKTAKDNEVSKGVDGNGLDYALVESDE